MASYRVNLTTAIELQNYKYGIMGRNEDSLQAVIASNPSIITGLPDLELVDSELYLVCREYPTMRGNIDILIITDNADLVIVETKLLKNPESHRAVVAQAVDYIKALSSERIDVFLEKISKKKQDGYVYSDQIKRDEKFQAILEKNFRTGNFQVVILGDEIHPNILGMVESIQAAPHLSFTMYLAELNAAAYDESTIIITPKIVANTLEVERSVVSIEVNLNDAAYKLDSNAPSKEGKGSKPFLTWELYLPTITNAEFRQVIAEFRDKWLSEIGDSINMGTVGFSAGMNYEGRRIPIQFVYDNKVSIISNKAKEGYGIPEDIYHNYKEDLKRYPGVYDKIIANKAEIKFDTIDTKTLKSILDASMHVAKQLKEGK